MNEEPVVDQWTAFFGPNEPEEYPPCPFCGDTDSQSSGYGHAAGGIGSYISSDNCGKLHTIVQDTSWDLPRLEVKPRSRWDASKDAARTFVGVVVLCTLWFLFSMSLIYFLFRPLRSNPCRPAPEFSPHAEICTPNN